MEPTTADDEKRPSPWFVVLIVAVILLFSIYATGVKAEAQEPCGENNNGTACEAIPPSSTGDSKYDGLAYAGILVLVVCVIGLAALGQRRKR